MIENKCELEAIVRIEGKQADFIALLLEDSWKCVRQNSSGQKRQPYLH